MFNSVNFRFDVYNKNTDRKLSFKEKQKIAKKYNLREDWTPMFAIGECGELMFLAIDDKYTYLCDEEDLTVKVKFEKCDDTPQTWIPGCILPKPNEYVLCQIYEDRFEVLKYVNDEPWDVWIDSHNGHYALDCVTAWMPLPKFFSYKASIDFDNTKELGEVNGR